MRRYLAAIAPVILGLTSPQSLAAQAKPDTLVKPAVRYNYGPLEKAPALDSLAVGVVRGTTPSATSFVAQQRADSAAVVDVIRKNFGERTHTILGVLVYGDSAQVRAQMRNPNWEIHYMLDRTKTGWGEAAV